MRIRLVPAVLALVVASCRPHPARKGQGDDDLPTFQSEEDRILYALGTQLGHSMLGFYPTQHEASAIVQGMLDHFSGARLPIDYPTYGPRGQALGQQRLATERSRIVEMAKAYVGQAAREPGATKTSGGAIFRTLRASAGPAVSMTGRVVIQYIGTFPDGIVFDSSYQRGLPATLDLSGPQLPCWLEAFPRMHVGEQARVVCPPELAFGSAGQEPNVPPDATVVYDIEVLSTL